MRRSSILTMAAALTLSACAAVPEGGAGRIGTCTEHDRSWLADLERRDRERAIGAIVFGTPHISDPMIPELRRRCP